MAYIDNSQTKVEINDAIRGNSVSNLAPTQVLNSVQPVINVNPKDYRRVNIIKRATSGTIYTTPADKDFFLTDVQVSGATVTAGNNTLAASVFLKGDTSATLINSVHLIPTVATDSINGVSNQHFKNPIPLERNTAIAVSVTGTVTLKTVVIFGYTVEN